MTSGQDHRRQQQQMDSRQPDLASRIVSAALENFAATSAAHNNASSSSPSSSSNAVDVDHNSLRRYANIVVAENADVLTLQSQLVLALHALDQMSSEQAQLLDQLRQELDLMSSSSEWQNISQQQQAQDPNEVDAAAGNDAAAMTEELEQSNLYAATLQIDLIRTRERMNDALCFAKTSANGRTRRRRRRRSRRTGLSGSFFIAHEVIGDEEVVEFEGQLNDLPADGNPFNNNNTNETNIQDTQSNNSMNIREENDILRATIASLSFDLTKVREQLNDERSVKHNRRRRSSSGHGHATKSHSRDEIEQYDIVAAAPPAEDMADATAAAAAAAAAAAVRPSTPDAATSTAEEAPTTPPAAKKAADATPAAVDDKLDSEVQQQQQQRPTLSRRASKRNSFVGSAA